MQNRRELEILKYIFDHKTLSAAQIGTRFWSVNGLRMAKLKLGDMQARGLVIQVRKDFLRVTQHYYLTAEGLAVLRANGLTFEVFKAKLPKPTKKISGVFQHDTKLADLRIALELRYARDTFRWIPESDIWADKERFGLTHPDLEGEKLRNRIPDGIIVFRSQNIIVEYEHASYDKAKFEKHIQAWEESWGQYSKLIITRSVARAEELRQKSIEQLGLLNKNEVFQTYFFVDFDQLISQGLPGKP